MLTAEEAGIYQISTSPGIMSYHELEENYFKMADDLKKNDLYNSRTVQLVRNMDADFDLADSKNSEEWLSLR